MTSPRCQPAPFAAGVTSTVVAGGVSSGSRAQATPTNTLDQPFGCSSVSAPTGLAVGVERPDDRRLARRLARDRVARRHVGDAARIRRPVGRPAPGGLADGDAGIGQGHRPPGSGLPLSDTAVRCRIGALCIPPSVAMNRPSGDHAGCVFQTSSYDDRTWTGAGVPTAAPSASTPIVNVPQWSGPGAQPPNAIRSPAGAQLPPSTYQPESGGSWPVTCAAPSGPPPRATRWTERIQLLPSYWLMTIRFESAEKRGLSTSGNFCVSWTGGPRTLPSSPIRTVESGWPFALWSERSFGMYWISSSRPSGDQSTTWCLA